ncbi:pali-domain-containing protein [Metschnikowia bicuspidata var. bicuspidata NRRL YB-4993]|uniref:Pali-domain-containing protein n=1 Tax=Metschnikowia bicuspidata var. bicuspidata NRRL YB-4993 TaxID=869754 RepID=A0A1A0HJR8_9ASCO|nr:pali-domain-containing protein [Metschnikowia bicuspidata var. bicuspidata NRRL YB-4993]OBA24137.1 pali-domain-containing protein [Metschnikowia bicuspidata var. bicuspidata NRRL YB-4993]
MRHAILTSISSFLLAVALAFLILSNVSTPVSSGLHLAASLSYTYGIFGYCDGDLCPSAAYPVLFGDVDTDSSWFFGSATRNTLSKTFIVAPIAAGFTFLAFVFTFLSLFVHASALKILSLVFSVVALVSSALIAVMAVLVFHPHVEWVGWLLVAAAGCCLVAAPLLFLSIGVREDHDADSDVDQYAGHTFGDISNMDPPGRYSAGSLNDIKENSYGYAVDPLGSSKEFSYRGPNTNEYPADRTDSLNKSLLEALPKTANDVTKPRPYMANGPGASINSFQNNAHLGTNAQGPGSSANSLQQNAYSSLNIQSGPSTPIASKRQLAPNVVPSEGMTYNIEQPGVMPPYPQKDHAPSIYSLHNYGVFDHHPTVEGHRPFTEAQDVDEAAERASVTLEIHADSDNESDFTSVSQRPPNESYVVPRVSPQRMQQQSYQQGMPPQAFQVPQGQLPARPQNQYASHVPPQPGPGQSYAPRAQGPGYGQPGQSYAQPGQNFGQPQMQAAAPRPVTRATISDNALSNNPDFAIGFSGRKKQVGRPGYGAPRPGAAFTPRTGQRDGPYGNI